jgi:hypothetical protein
LNQPDTVVGTYPAELLRPATASNSMSTLSVLTGVGHLPCSIKHTTGQKKGRRPQNSETSAPTVIVARKSTVTYHMTSEKQKSFADVGSGVQENRVRPVPNRREIYHSFNAAALSADPPVQARSTRVAQQRRCPSIVTAPNSSCLLLYPHE